jgi:ketosteroid isomerase-like protein
MIALENHANKAMMEAVMHAYKEGDLRPLLDAIDDNVVWKETVPVDFFRFGGTRRQRKGVTEAQAQIFSEYLFRRFEPLEIIATGDVVWGLYRVEATHLPSGKAVSSDYAMRWRVRGGKIVEHQGFFDSAGVLMQQGQIPAPAR